MLTKMSAIANFTAVKAIESYQKHLSPIKGFKCAAGQLYGGQTCSGAVKTIVSQQGLVSGIPAIVQQFSSCQKAAHELSLRPDQPMTAFCCCLLPIPL